ncbi:MAG: beta-lactamase family protein [Flavobacteriales bacterium]|nr:beta-lactamase family protein [Flavobacteriales bacterium]
MRVLFFLVCHTLALAASGQTLSSALQQVASNNGLVGMSVVAICNGQVSDVVHTGYGDLQRGIPVEDSTRYRIASISKLVTAIGLMKLHEQGAFALDDDVSTALGFSLRNPSFPNTPITYRMLLSHQSSLQDGSGYGPFLSATYASAPPPPIAQLVTPAGAWYTADLWRTEAPGTWFAYSNLNYGILGTLIEAHSGLRFDVFMRQQVLLPLGIHGSYNIQDLNDLDHLAVLYRNNNPQVDDLGGIMPTPPDLSQYAPGSNGLFFAPQGGLRASGLELGNVVLMLLQNGVWNGTQILQPTSVASMLGNEWTYNGNNGDDYYGLFRSWGLGVHRITAQPGFDVVLPGTAMFGHAGEAYGLISDLYLDPASGQGLVFLTNGYAPGYAYQFGQSSAFYSVEEEVYAALDTHAFPACNTVGTGTTDTARELVVHDRSITWHGKGGLHLRVYDGLGRAIDASWMGPGMTWQASWSGPLFILADPGTGDPFRLRLP